MENLTENYNMEVDSPTPNFQDNVSPLLGGSSSYESLLSPLIPYVNPSPPSISEETLVLAARGTAGFALYRDYVEIVQDDIDALRDTNLSDHVQYALENPRIMRLLARTLYGVSNHPPLLPIRGLPPHESPSLESVEELIKHDNGLLQVLIDHTLQPNWTSIRTHHVLQPTLKGNVFLAAAADMSPGEDEAKATVDAWTGNFKGNAHKVLLAYMSHYQKDENVYALSIPFTNSSGVGKSKTMDELAKIIICIPINLANNTDYAFPPPDKEVQTWILSASPDCELRMQALIVGYIIHLHSMLEDFNGGSEPVKTTANLALPIRAMMKEGGTLTRHGDWRRAFHLKALTIADKFIELAEAQSSYVGSPSKKYRARADKGWPHQPETLVEAAEQLATFLGSSSATTPTATIFFDEASCLTAYIEDAGGHTTSLYACIRRAIRSIRSVLGLWVVFSATAGNFHLFSPDPMFDPSMRIALRNLVPVPPFVKHPLDLFAQKVSPDGSWDLNRIASTQNIALLGRSLFSARYSHGDMSVKRNILSFTQDKLLGIAANKLFSSTLTLQLEYFVQEALLACLAVLLAVDFRSPSWLQSQVERRQVERHLRIITSARNPSEMITACPSEPLVAEAARLVMRMYPKVNPVKVLNDHIAASFLSPGDRGEVSAALILILAANKAAEVAAGSALKEPDLTRDGLSSGRVVPVMEFMRYLLPEVHDFNLFSSQLPAIAQNNFRAKRSFRDAFKDAHVFVNHFIKVEDSGVFKQDFVWKFIVRGAAVICKPGQVGMDLFIPVLMGTKLEKRSVSGMFIQVKNDKKFTDTVKPHLFNGMNPFDLDFFTYDKKAPSRHPIIRLVFALASDRSSVKYKMCDNRQSSRLQSSGTSYTSYTSYDIWLAGHTHSTFGTISPNQSHAELLDRARKDPYSDNPDNLPSDVFTALQKLTQNAAPCAATHEAHTEMFTGL